MSTLSIVFVFFILVTALLSLYFFGNVDKKQDRHPLQNMVYRLHQIHEFFGSLVRGTDYAVMGYLKARQDITIKPVNERNPTLYPARILRAEPLPALPPASLIADSGEEEIAPPAPVVRTRTSKRPRRLRVAGMD